MKSRVSSKNFCLIYWWYMCLRMYLNRSNEMQTAEERRRGMERETLLPIFRMPHMNVWDVAKAANSKWWRHKNSLNCVHIKINITNMSVWNERDVFFCWLRIFRFSYLLLFWWILPCLHSLPTTSLVNKFDLLLDFTEATGINYSFHNNLWMCACAVC